MTPISCEKCGKAANIHHNQWSTACRTPSCDRRLLLAPVQIGKRYVSCGEHFDLVDEKSVIDICECGDRIISDNILEVRNNQTVYESVAITPAYKRLYAEFEATRDRLEAAELTVEKLEADAQWQFPWLKECAELEVKNKRLAKEKAEAEKKSEEMREASAKECRRMRRRLKAKETELMAQTEVEKRAVGELLELQKFFETKEPNVQALSTSLTILASRNPTTPDTSANSARVKDEPFTSHSDCSALRKRPSNAATTANNKNVKKSKESVLETRPSAATAAVSSTTRPATVIPKKGRGKIDFSQNNTNVGPFATPIGSNDDSLRRSARSRKPNVIFDM